MALEFNTAGFALKWACESTAGTRPTTGYADIPDIIELPAINNAPSGIDVTPLSEPEWIRRIAGLKDMGDSLTVRSNGTTTFATAWKSLCSAAATAKAAGKDTWYEVVFPSDSGYTESFYFSGEPSNLGFYGASVNTAYQGDNYITPHKIEGFAAKST